MTPRKSSSSQKETVGPAGIPSGASEDLTPPEKVLPKGDGGAGKKRSSKASVPPAEPDVQSAEKKQRKSQRSDPAATIKGTASVPLGEDKASVEALEAPVSEQKSVAESSSEREAPRELAGNGEEVVPVPCGGDQKNEEEDIEESMEEEQSEQLQCKESEESMAAFESVAPGEGAEASLEEAEEGETPAAETKEAPPKSSLQGSACKELKGSDDRFSFVTKEGMQNLFQGVKKLETEETEERRESLGSAENSEQEGVDAQSSGSLMAVPSPPSERRKSHPKRTKAFYCKFSQTNAFKSFFENLGNVLTEVSLEIRKEGSFAGIMADSMDASRVTLVQGKVSGEVKLNVPPEKAIFCVTVKDFLDIFPNVHPQHFIELYRFEDSTDICLRIFEPSMKTTNICINIQTLDKSIDTVELNEMDYSFYVDVELNSFKNALKTAKNQGAESIQFLIYEVEKSSSFRDAPSKTVYFVIRYKGVRTAFSFPYESKIVSSACEEGAMHLKAIDQETEDAPDDSCDEGSSVNERLQDLKPLYQGTFLSRCLINFIKSMERSNLTLRLANEKPLIIDYPLGCSSTDGLRFVLAPTCPE